MSEPDFTLMMNVLRQVQQDVADFRRESHERSERIEQRLGVIEHHMAGFFASYAEHNEYFATLERRLELID